MNLTWKSVQEPDFKNMVLEWWQSLEDDRRQRAELRRCRTPTAVYVSPAYRDHFACALQKKLFETDGETSQRPPDDESLERALAQLSLPIGVLAHARPVDGEAQETHFAALFAQRGKGSPAMRDERFRRLMAIRDDRSDDLFTMLLRLVRLMDNVASLPGLLECGLFWNDRARIDWAKAYYPNRAE